MTTIIFDIETGPLPEDVLLPMLPPFDSESVRVGNLKDPAKIAEKIVLAEANHRADFLAKAPLSPLTGRVVAIGVSRDDRTCKSVSIIAHETEAATIQGFWAMLETVKEQNNNCPPRLVGFNSHTFDLPFLIRRGWALSIQAPLWLRSGRWWSEFCVDLREVWQLGNRQDSGSLDSICRALGIGAKTGDGADFARLWVEDNAKAREYLANDLAMTQALYERLCPQF